MAESAAFTPAEERQVREAFGHDGGSACPRCGVAMVARAMGGGSFGLGYRRQRHWLHCPQCRRSVLFDQHRGTRN